MGITRRQVEIVQHAGDGQPVLLGQATQQTHEALLLADVQGAGGLVQQQHLARFGPLAASQAQLAQGAGDHHPLGFAARKGECTAFGQRFEVEQGQYRVDFRCAGLAAQRHQITYRPVEAQGEGLGHQRPASGQGGGLPAVQWRAVEAETALFGTAKARQQRQQGALAGAVGADDGEQLPRPQASTERGEGGWPGEAGLDETQHRALRFSSSHRK